MTTLSEDQMDRLIDALLEEGLGAIAGGDKESGESCMNNALRLALHGLANALQGISPEEAFILNVTNPELLTELNLILDNLS